MMPFLKESKAALSAEMQPWESCLCLTPPVRDHLVLMSVRRRMSEGIVVGSMPEEQQGKMLPQKHNPDWLI